MSGSEKHQPESAPPQIHSALRPRPIAPHDGGELLRRILDAVPGGVVHVARDGSILDANPEALRILGLRFDELTDRYISDFDPETTFEDGSPCPVSEYPVAKVLATGEPQGPTTIGVRRPGGDVSWAVFRAVPVLAGDGSLGGAVVTFLDITERKRAEDELRKSEEKWRTLGQNLPDFVLVADREGRLVSINRVLPHLDEASVLASTIYDYLDPASRDVYRQNFAEAVGNAKTVRLETRGEGPGGATVLYETLIVPIVGAQGGTDRVLVVARDITERQTMLASLAEKERLASMGMIAASVAHEIMNPLTYVLANLDFAQRADDTQHVRAARALAEARQGAERMRQIVWDLRTLGRSGGGELFYVDARNVLETALRLSSPVVAGTADVELAFDDVPSVLASESRLCQVFINLLVNAAQAMEQKPRDERRIVVRTRHDAQAELVAIDITDVGEGIPQERLGRVFEPFFTTKRAGTGLGLSISRDIVRSMGGRIEVTSEVGAGSTFTVLLSTARRRA